MAKIILNNADLHFLRGIRSALQTSDRESIKRATDTRDAELGVMRGVDLVLSYTSVETAVIESHHLSSTKAARCPWITEVSDAVPGFRTRTDISFLGRTEEHTSELKSLTRKSSAVFCLNQKIIIE